MKITDNRKKTLLPFSALNSGQVFIENVEGDEYTQMKIQEVEENCEIYNAVSLTTGELYHIPPNTMVRVVQAELLIE